MTSPPTTQRQHVEVRPGAYADSVTLLQVSKDVAAAPGVAAAQVAMATPLNLEVLEGMGFDLPSTTPNDMVVALMLDEDGDAETALAAVDAALAASTRGGGATTAEAAPARTLGRALTESGADLALVSVPGEHAMLEAMDALDADRDVMIFSDNVPLEQEIALKDIATERGLLVMGPDCGTAMLGGLGLGFANTTRPGPVGIVAASGTGCQQLMCLLDAAGAGVGAALGVGGRDLSSDVAGRSTREALRRLDADPSVELAVVVSKPPAEEVAAELRAFAETLDTPVQLALLGPGQPDLTEAAESVLTALGREVPAWPTWGSPAAGGTEAGFLRGLFVGGTLCDEAMLLAADELGGVRSNIPLSPELALDSSLTAAGAHDDRLRRRRPDRRAGAPDDRPGPAPGPPGPRGRRPADRVHPDGRGARPRRRAGPRRRARARRLGGRRDRPEGRSRAAGRDRLRRHRGRPAGPVPPGGRARRGRRRGPPVQRPGHPPGRRPHRRHPMNAPTSTRAQPTTAPAAVAASGVDLFADAVAGQATEVSRVDWRPPMDGTAADLAVVAADPIRREANARAAQAVLDAQASVVDVAPASQLLGIEPGQFLHAGPPITWEAASGPLRGALMGAAALEGLVDDPEDAVALFERGDGVSLEPCHHRSAVGPMAGVVSPSMWMFVLEDPASGRRTYCTLNEGLGKVLRYGAYGPEVLEKLRWMSDVLGPLLAEAIRATGPIDITGILTQMLQMGDEAHNRNRAGTLMLLRDLSPALAESSADPADVAAVLRFIGGNDHFFLNLAMPACKMALDAARGIEGSTMVVAMARNGTEFGIQLAGTGDEWFTGPALLADGLFLGSYGPDDANPDIGDSAITETAGIGGFSMATAPAIVRFVGGTVPDALATTGRMREITLAANPRWSIPVLEFAGAPTGIDVTKVCRTGILPQINTGMAGRLAGVGQVGAGLVTPPAEIFPKALAALAERTRQRARG